MFLLAKSNDLETGSLGNYHYLTLKYLILAREKWFGRQYLILEINLGEYIKLLLFPDLEQANVAILTTVKHSQHPFTLLSHHVDCPQSLPFSILFLHKIGLVK